MPKRSQGLSPATFLHHPVRLTRPGGHRQCGHTLECTRTHSAHGANSLSTTPVNLFLTRSCPTQSIHTFRSDSKTIRICGRRFDADSSRKCVSRANSPFPIIFCISETRFFRSTIFILHINLMETVVSVSGECTMQRVLAVPVHQRCCIEHDT